MNRYKGLLVVVAVCVFGMANAQVVDVASDSLAPSDEESDEVVKLLNEAVEAIEAAGDSVVTEEAATDEVVDEALRMVDSILMATDAKEKSVRSLGAKGVR